MTRWAALWFGLMASPGAAACADDVVTLRGDWGQARFHVAIADDPQERAQGLMFVEEMGTLEGMLFIYERPQPVSFWMRNTLIPLDMIFVGKDGVIDHLHANAIPGDETSIPGGDEILAVLEINGGLSARLGISVGDELQHPSFGENAVFACDG